MAKDKNMNQDAANDEEMTVTLTLDDGTELECVVLTIFEAAPDCNKTGENEGPVREISRRGRFRKKIHYG